MIYSMTCIHRSRKKWCSSCCQTCFEVLRIISILFFFLQCYSSALKPYVSIVVLSIRLSISPFSLPCPPVTLPVHTEWVHFVYATLLSFPSSVSNVLYCIIIFPAQLVHIVNLNQDAAFRRFFSLGILMTSFTVEL